jgi:CheY-like chemotaxis protein
VSIPSSILVQSRFLPNSTDGLFKRRASVTVEASAGFRHHRLDVTLMDLRLPGSNGTDALLQSEGNFHNLVSSC